MGDGRKEHSKGCAESLGSAGIRKGWKDARGRKEAGGGGGAGVKGIRKVARGRKAAGERKGK